MGKAKVFYHVSCSIHGKRVADLSEFPTWYVVVPPPQTKKERFYNGCPQCAQERNKGEKIDDREM